MTTMLARDLMTTEVTTVAPDTPVLAVASLLADRHISAVPVVGTDGVLQGLVSEADLIRRIANEAEERPGWFAALFANRSVQAERFAKAHGLTAADVMTRNLHTVAPTTPVEEVANLLEQKHIRRAPVVEGGKLVGLVSRADLLRALVAAPAPAASADLSDEAIRRNLLDRLRREPWGDVWSLAVTVQDGIVSLDGWSRDPATARAVTVLAQETPGVKGVQDNSRPYPAPVYIAR
ncbi:CBS domain-containing protein [Roseomonas sp. OT10]|uniref:CBS domain-containing protein n=1 Tax=Roseomonas cutis TaxID=2897332 RepID=UPI001E5832A6|nr:CBS domain-containing protein [Roseomonas sp. OT10]UFN50518.1 CBS domain-containing protein [Roseomonas sp. OT10]